MEDKLFCGCCKDTVMNCLGLSKRKYLKGEVIARMSDKINRIGILEKGKAHISCIDYEGFSNVAERINEGGVFGEIFTMSDEKLEFVVEADSDCVVQYIDYDKIVRPCGNNCENHVALLNNLFHLAASKSRNLSQHINILSRRTTRQKLLTYFESIDEDGDGNVEIPLSFTALADYICADRSAMMRELKNMKDEGVILSAGKKIALAEIS